ncbi:MAG: integrase arm-type DNA-binding domain-containing protein [Alphaproteobacteria bacterium]
MAAKSRTANITDRLLKACKPSPEGTFEIRDTTVKGLSIRVSTAGTKSWSYRYRDQQGNRVRTKLGGYPALSLAKAREKAIQKQALVLDGADPRKRKLETVENLIDEFYTRYVQRNTRKAKQTRAIYDTHVLPIIGRYKLADLRRGDVVDLLDKLQDKGFRAQVNRVQSAISGALNWGVDAGYIEVNPILGLRRRFKEAPRDRVLNDAELRSVWLAATERTTPSRELTQILILTMQRRDEVRGMQWKELDEKSKTWTIPADRNKTKRSHIVPLPDSAWDIIDNMPRQGPYVFSVNGDNPYSGQSKLTPALRKSSGIDDWTLHDLRRTGRTGLSRLGVPPLISELILNHARDDLERTYDLHAFNDEKRAALTKWADHVQNVVLNAESGKVVSLR